MIVKVFEVLKEELGDDDDVVMKNFIFRRGRFIVAFVASVGQDEYHVVAVYRAIIFNENLDQIDVQEEQYIINR